MNIDKLPKWARVHIANLQRERDTAVKYLSEYCDTQTTSPFFTEDHVSDGEKNLGPTRRRHYIQTHSITVEWQDVQLRVLLRKDHIEMSWDRIDQWLEDIVFQPATFQTARLFVPKLKGDTDG